MGFLGTGETIAAARDWLLQCANGVEGEDVGAASFPGFTSDAGFFVDLVVDPMWDVHITRNELDAVTSTRGPKDRFEAAAAMVDTKLAVLAAMDRPPDCVFVALPAELKEKAGIADYKEARQQIHRDLRRVIKAIGMRHNLPTQLILPRTISGGRGVDHEARRAWNIFTALYFKLGAIPWSPVGLDADTCYVGVSFYRPLGSSSTMQASLAQAFNGRGDALVIRGDQFPWDPARDGKSPHLSRELAEDLIDRVVKRFAGETGKPPDRVVIHKSSRFWPGEVDGFKAALRRVNRFDFLSVRVTSDVRLLRMGDYPVLRGTRFSLGDQEYLYTTGYIPELATFPHGHLPSPLCLADFQHGDTPIDVLAEELMILSKLNWNSADFAMSLPITLGSARTVGDIMREVPQSQEPKPHYKFYV